MTQLLNQFTNTTLPRMLMHKRSRTLILTHSICSYHCHQRAGMMVEIFYQTSSIKLLGIVTHHHQRHLVINIINIGEWQLSPDCVRLLALVDSD